MTDEICITCQIVVVGGNYSVTYSMQFKQGHAIPLEGFSWPSEVEPDVLFGKARSLLHAYENRARTGLGCIVHTHLVNRMW